MTYQNRPSFRTDIAGDLWWYTLPGAGAPLAQGAAKMVHATSGNQFIRALQQALQTQIALSWAAPNGARYNRSNVNVDGRWGPVTQSGLIEWARGHNVSANTLAALELEFRQQNPRVSSIQAAAWLLFHRVQGVPLASVEIKPETFWPAWDGITQPPRGSPLLIVSWVEGAMTAPTNYSVAPEFGAGGGGSTPIAPGPGPQGGILPAGQQGPPAVQASPEGGAQGLLDSPAAVAGVVLLGAAAVVGMSRKAGAGRRRKKGKR